MERERNHGPCALRMIAFSRSQIAAAPPFCFSVKQYSAEPEGKKGVIEQAIERATSQRDPVVA